MNSNAASDDLPDAAPPAADIDRLLAGDHHNPHSVLGAHSAGSAFAVRTLRPGAKAVTLCVDGHRYPMERVTDALFAVAVPEHPGDYRLEVDYDGHTVVTDDPYRWLPTVGELDLHLIGEGRHERLWEVLGARVHSYETPNGVVEGTSFAVWAPNARGVRVIGDFNGWDGRAQPMRSLGSSGVWELFLPDVKPGACYKFRILGSDGTWHEKADPMAFATETPPATASVVTTSGHTWGDEEWVARREATDWTKAPMSVYEVHLASWRAGLDYRELAEQLGDYLVETGFTHVELLPVSEHPFGGSWGYQVTSYYAPTARFGSPDDFRYFVDHLHRRGIGVLVDWVPAHFPRDSWALARFDGTPLYEHADPRRGEQPDWGTLVFDFGRNEVRNFLVANALYWLDEFHLDGLRVDAVASMLYLDYSRKDGEWLPNQYGGRENLDAVRFLQELNATVYKRHPGVVMVAEESTAWPGVTRPTHLGGLGFGFKWNMGWMHDTLRYLSHEPVHRVYHHNEMTFSLAYAWSENFMLPLSHDEVVHGKGSLWDRMPGDEWNKAAGLRSLLAFMWAHPGKQLLFMGAEFGQAAEWAESRSLDWHLLDAPLHRGVWELVRTLNELYRSTPALFSQDTTPEGFAWIDASDAGGNVLSFLRIGEDGSRLACVANFAGTPHHDYRVGLPSAGRWREVLNTDAASYGGSDVGNLGEVEATKEAWHGQPASAVLQLPPAGVLWLTEDRHGVIG
ncbi:1,4-alpha-glucan branching protein GlgB [Amycolatopsis regifaucium]|uniref:1,4-alpha-glucan branching enzyme GlgB n=1 Tax=Amycolatopsis regifaucium TaxID=546365 RepID=A0A154M5U8_9PSEU|nr:1,4-alpha-glucan branching protein GlgB [Amycolatopsis regifaucium]KZB79863.1 glycogen-branching enzyme [Amycolatopsis regifaucium]OKA09820.1 1,4-alpha-glucan branching enzyme [Amycolatopsis regifaucium]SFJ34512.1 1,4-alpha-glucan branching enzyme [Amycolatopsis regifaucium]